MTTPADSKLMVATVCPDCDAPLGTHYILLGVPVVCTSCGHTVVPKVPIGTFYPITGYEITFGEFTQLLSDSASRSHVAPLLQLWFGYDVQPTGESFELHEPNGSHVDPLDLHLRIQKDSQKQLAIYRTAMSLWR